jgi:uncharacterized protein YcnI
MYKKLTVLGLFIGIFSIAAASTASAHVVVRPAEALTAGFQTFTVGAPNEKGVAFTGVKLLMPKDLKHVSITSKPGWQVNIEKEGDGETAVVKSVTWTGLTPPGYREDFTFSAQVPADATELQWKAYQTYEGGQTVAWDFTEDQQPKKQDGSPDFSTSGPFSVTKVVKETEAEASLKKVEQAAVDAKRAANRAVYIAVAGVAVGLVGVYLATRKK